MQLTIHQARFGQNEERGFALLDTTHPHADRIRRLSFAANLNPPDELRWEPALRGFAWEEYYVLLRTFADKSPGMRPGRVFSHALLFESQKLTALANIAPMLECLPLELDKHAPLASLELVVPSVSTELAVLTPRLEKLVQILVAKADSQPVVWAGQLDFSAAVCLAWRIMWPALRQQFRFGIGFAARDVKPATPQLLAVPNSLVGAWTGYPISKPTDVPGIFSAVDGYLLGNSPQATDLTQLLTALATFPRTLSELSSIQAVAPTTARLAEAAVPDLLALASVVATLCPSPAQAVSLKQALVARLIAKVTASDLTALIQLRTFDWQVAFGPTAAELLPVTTERFAVVLRTEPAHDLTPLLARLAEAESPNWWRQSVKDGFAKLFAAWQPALTPLVYSLWADTMPTTTHLLALLPTRPKVEADIVARLPQQLAVDEAQAGLAVARHQRWPILHMACALQRWPLLDALTRQLTPTAFPASPAALRYAQENTPAKDFVAACATLANEQLIPLAGELCAAQPQLLKPAVIDQPGWQRVWLASLEEIPKWSDRPDRVDKQLITRTWALLDLVSSQGSVVPGLLGALGKTEAADLRSYPQRAEIWTQLPEGRQDFLFATATSVMQQKEEIATLEPPLLATVSSLAFARQYLALPTTTLTDALRYFARFDVPEEAVMWYVQTIRPTGLGSLQAAQLGRQVLTRKWAATASQLFSLARKTPALLPALAECLSLLPTIFDRLTASLLVRHVRKVPIDPEEWWRMLLAELREVYPRGPTQDRIWLASGGKEDILQHHGNGIEQWADLVYRLRQNPPISLQRFLTTLMHENRQNQVFQLLYSLLPL